MILTHTPAQLKRAQRNGTAATHKGAETLGVTRRLVLIALSKGPMLLNEISDATGKSGTTLARLLNSMLTYRQIIVIGTAEQAGKTAYRRDARVWALPGTPMLPKLKPVVSVAEHAKNVAPGWYRPGPGPELHRDLRAHQRLAEGTHK